MNIAFTIVLCLFSAPEESPEGLLARGEAQFEKEDWAAARRSFAAALAGLEAAWGDETAAAHADLWIGRCLVGAGQTAEALEHLTRCLARLRLVHGEADHEDVARCRFELGHQVGAAGRLPDAIAHHEAAIAMRRRLHGGDHRDVAEGLSDLAYWLSRSGDREAGVARNRESLAMWKRLAPEGSRDSAITHGNLAHTLFELRRYEEAATHFARSAELWRRHMPDDLARLALKIGNVAESLSRLGRRSEALPPAREALALFRRAHPGDHPEVLVAIRRVVTCLGALKRPEEALPLLGEGVGMARRLRDESEIFAMVGHLAGCLHMLDRYREALPLAEETLAMARRRLPANDPALAEYLLNSGSCLTALDRHRDARGRLEEALAIRRRVPMGDPSRLAFNLSLLGRCLMSLGREREALPHLEERLGIRRRLHEGDHQLLTVAIGDLAVAYLRLGRLDEAERLSLESLAMIRRIYPGDDPEVAVALHNHTDLLQDLGRPEEAHRVGEESLEIARRLGLRDARMAAILTRAASRRGGAAGRGLCLEALAILDEMDAGDHPAKRVALDQLAKCLLKLHRPKEALRHQERALAMARRLYPDGGGHLANSLTSRAGCLMVLGRCREALEYSRKSLAERRRVHPEGSHDVVEGINGVGQCLSILGREAEALTLHREAVAMLERVCAGDHPYLASELHNLAGILRRVGRPAEALALGKRALAMARRMYRGDSALLADVLRSSGDVLVSIGRTEEGLRRLEQALTMHRRLASGDDTDVASTLHFLGSALETAGRGSEALDLHRSALAMIRRIHEGDHLSLVRSLHKVSHCIGETLGRPQEATEIFEEAVAISHRLFECDHPALATSIGNLGFLYAMTGQIEKALPLQLEALAMGRRVRHHGLHTWLGNVADSLRALGRGEEALPYLVEAIDIVEFRRRNLRGFDAAETGAYLRTLRASSLYDRMVTLQLELGRPDEALRYLERGRARGVIDLLERSRFDPFAEGLRRAESSNDEATLARFRSVAKALAAADEDFGRLSHALTLRRESPETTVEELDTLGKNLDRARKARVAAARDRSALVRDLVPAVEPRSPGAVRGLLAADERMLVYLLRNKESKLLVVPPPGGTIRAFDLRTPLGGPVTVAETAKVVDLYLAALQRDGKRARGIDVGTAPGPLEAASIGHAIFRGLVPAAVWKELRDVRRVYLVPHGALHRLPFETLVVDPEKRTYWLDEGPEIVYGPSGSVLLWCRERADERPASSPRHEVVALGDPIFSRSQSSEPAEPPAEGLLVVAVEPGTEAARAGLRGGDVLLAYDGAALKEAKGLGREILRVTEETEDGDRSGSVAVRYWRRGREHEVSVEAGRLGVRIARESPPVAWKAMRDETVAALTRGASLDAFGPLAALPGTRREVESIRETLGKDRVAVLMGEDAREAELHRLAPQARWLHLATHQLVDESDGGSFSRLALTLPEVATARDDGFLRLIDLFERWRDRLSACELVVLSACETHRGPTQRDEAPHALPLGFLYAGAPAVIASLWRVDDESTADLFADFYRRLKAQGGRDKLKAFTEARRALRKTRPEPYFWAPFVYLGDPR